ncbi:MAG: VOC family protein [Bacteroidetes bacterium]|nr:VOC family protein [Bacteroidota bacterium]
MKIEHVAFNVEDPVAMSIWYEKHLGLRVVKQQAAAPYMTFLADDSGQVMIEIYRNPVDGVPDYKRMDPLVLHLAFVSEDPSSDKARLLEAGAELVSEMHLDDGSHLLMMRDPWGLALQFCKRGMPMLVP